MLLKRILLAMLFLLLLDIFAATVFAQKVSNVIPKRVPATDFIIFPWGRMRSEEIDSGVWGDLANANAMMKDVFDCGSTQPASFLPDISNMRFLIILP
jgi:hypothetical protein